MTTQDGWKFLDLDADGTIRSRNGGTIWRVGAWQGPETPVLCASGYHDSPDPLSALRYVNGTVLARTETRGDVLTEDGWPAKRCSAEMRLLDARRWEKRDSVALTLVMRARMLAIWDNEYPNDPRPRRAYDAAQAWLDAPSEETRVAADAAAAAYAAAYAAASANAANAAYAASAADAAYYAAASADAAAVGGGAHDEVRQELAAWMVARFEQLELVAVDGHSTEKEAPDDTSLS